MFVSVALAFLAVSAPPAETSVSPPAAPAAKPRRICRSEAVIGSIASKRVCTIVAPRNAAPGHDTGQSAERNQQRTAQESAGSGN